MFYGPFNRSMGLWIVNEFFDTIRIIGKINIGISVILSLVNK